MAERKVVPENEPTASSESSDLLLPVSDRDDPPPNLEDSNKLAFPEVLLREAVEARPLTLASLDLRERRGVEEAEGCLSVLGTVEAAEAAGDAGLDESHSASSWIVSAVSLSDTTLPRVSRNMQMSYRTR